MKILKIIEKAAFVVSVVVVMLALSLSFVLDAKPANGLAMALTVPFAIGFGFVVVFLLLGALLRYNKNVVASRIGDALTLAAFATVFATALYLIASKTEELSPILGLVGFIVYALSSALRFVIYLYGIIKPIERSDCDPDNDRKIQLIIKWKALLDKGVITKDEFEAKRTEILALEKPVEEKAK